MAHVRTNTCGAPSDAGASEVAIHVLNFSHPLRRVGSFCLAWRLLTWRTLLYGCSNVAGTAVWVWRATQSTLTFSLGVEEEVVPQYGSISVRSRWALQAIHGEATLGTPTVPEPSNPPEVVRARGFPPLLSPMAVAAQRRVRRDKRWVATRLPAR
jgi:hypothetical protein